MTRVYVPRDSGAVSVGAEEVARSIATEAILRDAPFLINILLWGLVVVWIVYGREAGLK